jgi:hypothetical protein
VGFPVADQEIEIVRAIALLSGIGRRRAFVFSLAASDRSARAVSAALIANAAMNFEACNLLSIIVRSQKIGAAQGRSEQTFVRHSGESRNPVSSAVCRGVGPRVEATTDSEVP